MKVLTTRFGEVEVPEDDRVTFPNGILGFSDVQQYVLLKTTELGLFRWLQSTEIPALAFVVCDPRLIVPDYGIELPFGELEDIGVEDASQAEVMVILTRPHDIDRMTANLQGPIIYSRTRRLAKQLVLTDDRYSCRYRVFNSEPAESAQEVRSQSVA